MKKDEAEVHFKLTTPFEYAFKGEKRVADFISLTAPNMRQHHLAAPLAQSVMKMFSTAYTGEDREAITQAIEDKKENEVIEEKESEETVDAETILTLMYSSKTVDINVIFEQAKTLFKFGIALIDGESKLNDHLIHEMAVKDFENLVGEYIANFIIA